MHSSKITHTSKHLTIMNTNSSSQAGWSWWFSATNDQPALIISTPITYALIIVFLTITTWSVIVKKRSTPTPSLPPGPKGLPVFGNLLSLDLQLHTHFANLSKTYGPIYTLRLGQKLAFVITSPALAKEVLKDQDATFANRDVPAAGREGTYGGSNIVSSSNGPQLRMLRRVCIRELLSNANLDSMYDLRRRELRRTIKYLYGMKGSPVTIGESIFTMMLDVVTSMMWGGTMKGDDEKRVSVGVEFKEAIEEITGLLMLPNVSDFYPFLERFDLQGIQERMRRLAKRFDNIFQSVIDQRIKMDKDGNGGGNKDFVQVLLQLKDKDGDGKTSFTMNNVKALLTDMVVGGTDTTASNVEFALAELMNRPELIRRLQQELDQVVGRDRTVEESDIQNLLFLHAVMKEALRLHPPLPLLVPHCPSSDCNVSGYTIPKGSRVIINTWAIQRDPTIWEDPTKFLPERFTDAGWDYSGNDFRYFPFGSGRRICAGVAMGERMSMYILASFIHSFDWDLPCGQELDLSDKFGIITRKSSPLVAVATPRLSDPTLYD